jgi:hypothetical protein
MMHLDWRQKMFFDSAEEITEEVSDFDFDIKTDFAVILDDEFRVKMVLAPKRFKALPDELSEMLQEFGQSEKVPKDVTLH